jgi:hypothetical protein
MVAHPRESRSRSAALVGAAALSIALAGCGGSLVSPKDFVGVGEPVAGSTSGPATTTDGASVPGGTTVVPPGPVTTANQAAQGGGAGPGSPQAGGNPTGAPAPGVKAGNCAGLKNADGITAGTIDIATIADVSGAVPNGFKSAFDAMNAYVAYFNSTSTICGRKLKLQTIDSGLTANGSNSASKAACSSAFATVGSFSAFDGGGANVTAACGQPDLRASAVERARQQARTTFMAMPMNTDHIALQPWIWAKQTFGAAAVGNAAFVYLNAGASKALVQNYIKATTARLGYSWKKVIVVDIAGVPNWNGYANQLKAAGIKFVAVDLADFTPKLAAAFKQADFHPIFYSDAGVYGQKYLSGGDGSAMTGAYVWTQTAMIEEAGRVPEMALYQTWLQRTGGGAPSYAGAEAWAAGVMFTQLAVQLGGKLSRASMVQAAAKVRNFTGNGIISRTDPGARTSAPCFTIMQVKGGRFTRYSPFPYTCGPLD